MALDPAPPARSRCPPVGAIRGTSVVPVARPLLGGAGVLALGAPTLLAACGGSSGSDDGAASLELTARRRAARRAVQLPGQLPRDRGTATGRVHHRQRRGTTRARRPDDAHRRLSREDVRQGRVPPRALRRGHPDRLLPLFTTFDEPGIWGLTTTFDGEESTQSLPGAEPDRWRLVQPGRADGPRRHADRGRRPRGRPRSAPGTRTAPCTTVSLTDVLAAGQPVALMISTPAVLPDRGCAAPCSTW